MIYFDAVSVKDVEDAPSIDIVRCKECKNFRPDAEPAYERCRHFWAEVDEEDWCVRSEKGKRKSE